MMKINMGALALAMGLAGALLAEPGVTDKEILLGQSAAFSGPAAGLGAELWRGAEACFSTVNDAGGVYGRQIRVEALDDAYEGAKTLPNTLKLVKEDQVFALFGYVGTPTLVAALPSIVKEKSSGLFLFSDFSGAQPQREDPFKDVVFNVRASYRQETAALVRAFRKDLGVKKVGVFIQNDPYGRSGLDGVKRALEEEGLQPAAVATYERNLPFETSMAAQVKVLQAGGAEAVVAVGAYTQCAAFIRDARAAGFNGWIANVSFVGPDALLRLLIQQGGELTEHLVNSQVVPCWTDSQVALVADYAAAMEKAAPRLPSGLRDGGYKPMDRSFESMEGYINARFFVEVAKAAGASLTRASFSAAALKTPVDLGGFKLAFDPATRQASSKVFFTVVKDGSWASVPGLKGLK